MQNIKPTSEPEPIEPSADSVIAQIEAEEHRDGTDRLFDDEQPAEAPTIVTLQEKNKLKRLLKSKKFWFSFIGLILAAAALLWLLRPTRVFIVNALGLRAPLTIQTIPEAGDALAVFKQIDITVNGTAHKTNDQGVLSLQQPYGDLHLEVTEPGYEAPPKTSFLDFDPFFYLLGGKDKDEAAHNITWAIKSVGIPVTFSVTDWLSEQPLTTGTFSAGNVVAGPNEQGQVQMVLPATDAQTAKIMVTFDGSYLAKTIEVRLGKKESQTFSFVPAGTHYFISKRSGQSVVYSSNLDGSNVAEVVPASANETADIAFSVSSNGKYGLLASAREGKHSARGVVLQKLYVVDLGTKKLTSVDEAERFMFADWSGNTLVYTAITTDTTGAPINRLASIDTAKTTPATLAQAAQINPVRVGLVSAVYLARATIGAQQELRVVKIGGGPEKNLGNDVLALAQPDFDRFAYQTADQQWHEYNLNTTQVKNTAAPPSPAREFLASPSGDQQTRLVIDKIDGKRALIAKTVANGQEKQLFAAGSIRGPVRWVGNVVVFRMVDAQQSADFAVSLKGGQPKKISDVSASAQKTEAYFDFN